MTHVSYIAQSIVGCWARETWSDCSPGSSIFRVGASPFTRYTGVPGGGDTDVSFAKVARHGVDRCGGCGQSLLPLFRPYSPPQPYRELAAVHVFLHESYPLPYPFLLV